VSSIALTDVTPLRGSGQRTPETGWGNAVRPRRVTAFRLVASGSGGIEPAEGVYAHALGSSLPFVTLTTVARRAGPREHGHQAARSKRDRPARARELEDELTNVRAAEATRLIP
jgi:hypothetical protein